MARCTVGYGVNKEYFPEASELFSVCPDCMWKWIQFLCSGPCRELQLHQTAALITMTSNASSFSARHNNPRTFIKHFLLCNSASEVTLTHARQGHRAFEFPSLSVAMEKIGKLIYIYIYIPAILNSLTAFVAGTTNRLFVHRMPLTQLHLPPKFPGRDILQ